MALIPPTSAKNQSCSSWENYPQFFTPAAHQPAPLSEMIRLLGLSPDQCPLVMQEPSAIPAALDFAFAPSRDAYRAYRPPPFAKHFPCAP